MAAKKLPPFPKSILVKQDQDGDDTFLIAGTAEELSESGEKVKVARYVLAGEGIVHNYSDYIEGAKD